MLEPLQILHKKLLEEYKTILDLIEKGNYSYASGSMNGFITLVRELEHCVENIMAIELRKIFEEYEMSKTFEDVVKLKENVSQWAAKIVNSASELQKILHDSVMRQVDVMKILEQTQALQSYFLYNPLEEFEITCRHIFLEYSVLRIRELEDKKEINIYKQLKLHRTIRKVSESLFKTGNYAQAIFEAFKCINIMVKQKTGINDKDGKDLMSHVFRVDRPILKLNKLQTTSEKNEQEGFEFIFMGAMVGIRNPKAHEIVEQKDPYRALEYLCLASLLAKRIEESELTIRN